MVIYTKKSKIYSSFMANGFAQTPRSLRILASLRNKRISYVFCWSNFLITTTSSTTFGSENGSKAVCFDVFLSQSYSHRKSGNSESINSLEGCLPKKRESFLAIPGQGPFLERPCKLTGPLSYFEIEVSRKVGCVLTSNEVHFVSLAENFTV